MADLRQQIPDEVVKASGQAALATDAALVVALSPNSPVALALLAKGTQGATGVTTQPLRDAGRSAKAITLDGYVVAATTEVLVPFNTSTDNGTPASATSYTVSAGKRLRLQQLLATIHTIGGNTTASNVIIRLRAIATAPALVGSPLQLILVIPGIAAAGNASSTVMLDIPDGWELPAGAGLGITVTCGGYVATTAAPKVDLSLLGYEY